LKIFKSLTITLRPRRTTTAYTDRHSAVPSEAFDKLSRSSELNSSASGLAGEKTRGGYLFVTPDQYVDELQPLVEWKRQKGHPTEVARLSQIGPAPDNNRIRQFIIDFYHQAQDPPEFVVLVGDVNELPTFFYEDEMEEGRGWDAADHPYSMLEGEDYFPDVFLGRLSVTTANQLRTVVHKIISYERDPFLGQTDWYKSALMVCN
jgi:hypothetical protein